MMKPAFLILSFTLGLTCQSGFAAINDDPLFAAPETLWLKSQEIPLPNKTIQILSQIPSQNEALQLEFRQPNSKSLMEKGDLRLERKILLNAEGTEVSSEAFNWDFQLELRYTFI
jgi:hypothetical protein